MHSDRWVEVSPSPFDHEREGLERIKEILPDAPPFRAWSNFEFRDNRGRWHEVDLLVLARDTLYLIELKYYRGFGGRAGCGPNPGGTADDDTADHARHDTVRGERGVEEIGRARLAVGAGDAVDLQVVGGMTQDPRRQRTDHVVRPIDDERRQQMRRPVAEPRDRTAGAGFGREVQAVDVMPGQRYVQIARLHRPGIVADPGDHAVVTVRRPDSQDIAEVLGDVADPDLPGGAARIVRVGMHGGGYPVRGEMMRRR